MIETLGSGDQKGFGDYKEKIRKTSEKEESGSGAVAVH